MIIDKILTFLIKKLKLVHVDQEMIMNSGNKISTELEDGDVVLLEYEDVIHIWDLPSLNNMFE